MNDDDGNNNNNNDNVSNMNTNMMMYDRVYTTIIGIGVDFNTDLVSKLTSSAKGCNYFSVKSAKEFERILNDEFEYMVTPLLFDLKLKLAAHQSAKFQFASPGTHFSALPQAFGLGASGEAQPS